MTTPIDLILHHASVITMNPRHPRAELVAIAGERVLHVGSNDDLESLKSPHTRVFDCEGKTLVPGFNDAHCHVMSHIINLLGVDCSKARSIAEIKVAIARRARQTPPDSWILGTGYNEFYLAEKRHPTRWDLDEAAPNHPVRLIHRTWHAMVVNSLALSRLGLSIETPEPPDALFDRVPETGELNGVLFRMERYVREKLPLLSEEQLEKGLKLVNSELLSLGITSIQDASQANSPSQWQAFKRFQEKGHLTSRVSLMIGAAYLKDFQQQRFTPHYGDHQLRLGAVKIILDRATGSLQPPQEVLSQQVLEAHKAGFQLALHSVEENTLEAAITALEQAVSQIPRSTHRHRIEHCSICPPPLLQRLKTLKAMVVTQPAFVYYSGERYLKNVPASELPWLYRIGSFHKARLKTAASSDCPVVPLNPLVGIYAAVSRQAKTGQVLLPEEGITPSQALAMYTRNGAYAAFDEGVKGTISPGKLADVVLLSGDPTRVPPQQIKELKVEMTILGGKVAWNGSG